MKKIWKAWFVMTAAALVLTGCGKKREEAPINVALIDDIVSLDVAGTKDIMSETVGRCVFSTLYTFDENLNLLPCLAESSEQISEKEWIYYLNKDVKFHDGSSLTASDVKFSLERAKSIELADKSLMIIEQIEAVDEYTVKITTAVPITNLSSFLVRTSSSIMSEKAVQSPGYDFNKPIGSGPFKVVECVKGKEIKLERFDEYFKDPAQSKYLNFIIEPSEQNSTAAILNGNIDVLFRVSANDADYLSLNESIKVYQGDSTKTEFLLFNSKQPPLADIRVRQAIAYAIDKENIIYNVMNGYGRLQSSIIPAPLIGFQDFNGYTYDVEKSLELLKEAGYEDGFDFTVLTFDVQRKKLMEYLKLDLAKVNIRLNYDLLELNDYLKIIEKQEQMASVMNWTSDADPDSMLTQMFSKAGHITVNQSGFTDERVEALLEQGRSEKNEQMRDEIYSEVNQIIAESYSVLPLYQSAVLVAARKEISGVKINPQGIFAYDSLVKNVSEK